MIPVPAPAHHDPSEHAISFFAETNFLVVKLTDYCNLRCKYCHQDALNGKPVLMPMETFRNAVRLVLKPSQAPTVYIQFHGGEPLLCPDDFFREAVSWAKQELETTTRRVIFCMQTNLTRLNAERERLLNELGILLSFSMDGPPAMNDELRGGGRRILENWRRMKENGTRAGTICLISSANWDRMPEVIRFFEEEGILDIKFNLLVPDGRGKDVETATVDKLFEAKRYVLDYMLETKGQKVVDASLYNAMKRFVKSSGAPVSREYHGCESFYCQAGRSLYSVNPDGRFYACDRIAENPAWAMGNVNQTFASMHRDHALDKRHAFQHKDEWWSRCNTCNASKICEFSCSAYYVDKVDTREIECQYTKAMWRYMLTRRDDIILFMRRSQRPVVVDEKTPLRQQGKETWILKDIAADASFARLSLNDILASNRHYQLLQRGSQYFLYVFERAKIFEVDRLVAEIARYNGLLSPALVREFLAGAWPAGTLHETIANIEKHLPEIFSATKGSEATARAHALHESSGCSHSAPHQAS